MKKNEMVIGFLIMVVILLSIGTSSASLFGKEDTKLDIVSDDDLYLGDDFKVNLTKEDGNAIDNASVNITFTDENGENQTFSILTDQEGIAKLELNDFGKYLVNCTFEGGDDFNPSNATQNLTVNYISDDDGGDDSNDDPGAFYSEQEGRVIYTGEVHWGPDEHRYEHLGYNEWKQID